MITVLRKSTFGRLLLPFILGIVLQYHLRLSFTTGFIWMVTGVLSGIFCFSLIIRSYFWRGLFGMVVTCLSLWVAVLLTTASIERSSWDIPSQPYRYCLVLLENAVPKSKTLMCKARIVGSDSIIFNAVADKWVIVYLPKDEQSGQLAAGNGIEVEAVLKRSVSFENGGFDYAAYLEQQGFSAIGYVPEGKWVQRPICSLSVFDKIKFLALDCQHAIINQLKRIIPDENNAIVAAALFVGYKAELDPELKTAFALTGTSHILAVSGFHFAVLFAILCFVFSPFEWSVRFRATSRLIIVLILWLFAFISGLAPSIVRACIMICFIGFGAILNRRSMTMNSLAGSALFMLIYNPLYLYDIGFQLSYAAVAGIVMINPYLVWLKEFEGSISRYFWELSCVSISAQVGTAPLSLYYFHQFPLIFILTNMFVIPLAGLLMLLLPLCVLIQAVYPLPIVVYLPVNYILNFFVSGVEMFSMIPFSVLTDISIDAWGVVSMYAGIVLVAIGLIRKRVFYLCLLLLLVVLQVFYYF